MSVETQGSGAALRELKKERASVASEADRIQTLPDPVAKENARRKLELDIREELEMTAPLAETARQGRQRSGHTDIAQQDIRDATAQANIAAVRAVEGVKSGIIPVGEPQKNVLTTLAPKLNTQNSYALHQFVDRVIRDPNYLQLSPQGGTPTQLEVDLQQLALENFQAAQQLFLSLQATAHEGKLGSITEADVNRQENIVVARGAEAQARQNARLESQEMGMLAGNKRELYREMERQLQRRAEKELLYAIFNPEDPVKGMGAYIKKLMYGEPEDPTADPNVKKEYPGVYWKAAEDKLNRPVGRGDSAALQDSSVRALAEINLSEELRRRMMLVVGRIYQPADESDPKAAWREALQQGSALFSIAAMSKMLMTQIFTLRNLDYGKLLANTAPGLAPDGEPPIQFWGRRERSHDRVVDSKSRYGVVDETGKSVEYKTPRVVSVSEAYFDPVRVNSDKFFTEVHNDIHEVEESNRAFFHDIRSAIYQPAPEAGFYGWLSKKMDADMPANAYDDVMHMPDADIMRQAGSLIIKYLQADFARYDWIHQPAQVALLGDVQLTALEAQVFNDLLQINPDKDVWEIRRALIMAIGDNWSMMMGYIETNALGDPPKNPDGSPDYASFDKGESSRSAVFNPLWQENLRFESEYLVWAYLLFMKTRKGTKTEFRHWDHTELKAEMIKVLNAYTVGKPPEDVDDDVVRFVNMFNSAKIGSMYTRGGWRLGRMYDYALVREGEAHTVNAVESVRALENMGVEIMKHFLTGHSFSHIYGTDGYHQGVEQHKNSDARRDLYRHLYSNYIYDSEVKYNKQDVTLQQYSRFFAINDLAERERVFKENFPDIDINGSVRQLIYGDHTNIKSLASIVRAARFESDFKGWEIKNIGERIKSFKEEFPNYAIDPGPNGIHPEIERALHTAGDRGHQIQALNTAMAKARLDYASNNPKLWDTYKDKNKAHLEKKYKEFYFKVLTHAIVKRAPSKLLRMERNREVVGRSRAWQMVLDSAFDSNNEEIDDETRTSLLLYSKREDRVSAYDRALKDICLVESQLRRDVSNHIDDKYKAGTKMNEIEVQYEFTEDVLKTNMMKFIRGKDEHRELTAQEKGRIAVAVRVYQETMKFYFNKKSRVPGGTSENPKFMPYLDDFARRWSLPEDRKTDMFLKVSLMPEEIMREALEHSAPGPTMPKRVAGDMDKMEKNVTGGFRNLFGELVKAAQSHKHEIGALDKVMETLAHVKATIRDTHDEEAANTVIREMAEVVIGYFRKDTGALLHPLKYANRPKNLAQEMLQDLSVWAWDAFEIDEFLHHLSKKEILPYHGHEPVDPSSKGHHHESPHELRKTIMGVPVPNRVITIPGLGIKFSLFGSRVNQEQTIKNTGESLMKEFMGNPVLSVLRKFAPYAVLGILMMVAGYFYRGLKEGFGEKK